MKNLLKLAFVAFIFVGIISCDNEDDSMPKDSKGGGPVSENKVDAYIQFENVFGEDDFKLNKNFASANNGTLNITTLKYIITDIKLFGTEGTSDFQVSTQESFHIVDQSCKSTINKYLTNIPNGKYNKVSIRYGVSDAIQNAGTDAQGEMLIAAKAKGLNWGWTLGYRFMTYEGISSNKKGSFKVHNGSTGAIAAKKTVHTSKVNDGGLGHKDKGHGASSGERIDNSQVVEIDFSSEGVILVSDNTSPKIHLKVDIAKILTSKSSLNISEGDIIIDAHKSTKVAKNVASMFSLAHIHPTDMSFNLPEIKTCEDTSNPNEGDGHTHTEGENHDDADAEKTHS